MEIIVANVVNEALIVFVQLAIARFSQYLRRD